jgi:hypothetical protein
LIQVIKNGLLKRKKIQTIISVKKMKRFTIKKAIVLNMYTEKDGLGLKKKNSIILFFKKEKLKTEKLKTKISLNFFSNVIL